MKNTGLAAANNQVSRDAEGAVFAADTGSSRSGCSSAMRASPIACSRCLRSFVRQRRTSLRMEAGVLAGSASQSGSSFSTVAKVSGDRVAPERPCARQHLVQHRAKGPDIRAPVGRVAAGLLRRHVRRRAQDHAHACGPQRQRGRVGGSALGIGSSIAFARPKSSTFTTPSGVILMLAGFRSRWTTPRSCAYSSASAICFA